MGGESSGGGSSVDRSNPNEMRAREMAEATNRAKEEQERKSRQVAFDDYQEQRKAAAQGIDVMISPQKAETVRENASLAMMLDERAKKSEIKVPIPTIGTVAMGTISTASARQQARALRSGGIPVYDNSSPMFDRDKDYRGVVSTNKMGVSTYSGDPDFSPIGRQDGSVTKMSSGSYSVTKQDATQGSGDNDPPAEMVVSPPPKDTTEPVKKPSTPSISTASRRALISGAGGGATRRILL